jgi:HSP20 family protein
VAKNERNNQLEPRRQVGSQVERGRDPYSMDFWDPFNVFQRFNQQMDRMFGDIGSGREWRSARPGSTSLWAPQIEAFQRGDQFIVRADLPGLKKDDVEIEVTDKAITLRGERKEEHEENREGFYRTERSYGSFYREIPLPEGAITESAKANFKDGVLELTVQAPPREVSRGRRIEISEGRSAGKDDARSSRS